MGCSRAKSHERCGGLEPQPAKKGPAPTADWLHQCRTLISRQDLDLYNQSENNMCNVHLFGDMILVYMMQLCISMGHCNVHIVYTDLSCSPRSSLLAARLDALFLNGVLVADQNIMVVRRNQTLFITSTTTHPSFGEILAGSLCLLHNVQLNSALVARTARHSSRTSSKSRRSMGSAVRSTLGLDAVDDAQEERAKGRDGTEDDDRPQLDGTPCHELVKVVSEIVAVGDVWQHFHAEDGADGGQDTDGHESAEAYLDPGGSLQVPDDGDGPQGEDHVSGYDDGCEESAANSSVMITGNTYLPGSS